MPDTYSEQMILAALEGNNIIASKQPNLVLVHAGTNDNTLQWIYQDEPQPNTVYCPVGSGECIGNTHPTETYADAPNRLGHLLDFVLLQDPNAVVLVAQLIQDYYNATQWQLYNAAIPDVVAARRDKGYKVKTVDLTSVAPGWDGKVHPNNTGYQQMADIWYSAMLNVPTSWWTGTSNTTRTVSGDIKRDDSSTTQWIPQWGNDGDIALGAGYPGEDVRLADLDGDGRADYLVINFTTGSVRAYLNKGLSDFEAVNNGDEILFGPGDTNYVEFADVTGDKKADYIVKGNDGAFRVFVNDGPNGNAWKFHEDVAAGNDISYLYNSLNGGFFWFGDLNGDGRADFIVLPSNGYAVFALQGSQALGANGFEWTVCPLQNSAFSGILAFPDIDGDGRADIAFIAADGSVSGALNEAGGGNACGISFATINGGGPSSLAYSFGNLPGPQIRLADVTGDGKADYLTVSNDVGQLDCWPNEGYFGSKPGSSSSSSSTTTPPSTTSTQPTTTATPGSGCVMSPCQNCFGEGCPGGLCQGMGCNTCNGTGCAGCDGPDCYGSTGTNITVCTSDCYACEGTDCDSKFEG
ncbi:hypothetical protein PRZ48_000919 [Zasmidium cellare]|uniref:SGNH hydrolase-type esterase domain-containing protein n=1 Tax=Zasmidium cellare TaxID=395010 RepID=A0ABR0F0G5_ZASCE|nr:hypothetical protein PRZ48_000919 [Zasmidium cellare]